MVADATAEQGVLGLIPGSDKVLLGFSIRDFSVTVMESGFVPIDGNRVAFYYMELKNITGEMFVHY